MRNVLKIYMAHLGMPKSGQAENALTYMCLEYTSMYNYDKWSAIYVNHYLEVFLWYLTYIRLFILNFIYTHRVLMNLVRSLSHQSYSVPSVITVVDTYTVILWNRSYAYSFEWELWNLLHICIVSWKHTYMCQECAPRVSGKQDKPKTHLHVSYLVVKWYEETP